MSDEIIWQVINQHFCAFKIKTEKQNFCRNEYNVSGLCNRQSCPLANGRYATVKSVDGKLYLYMKTAERSHMPSRWWERIRLSKNYTRALAQIDDHLQYWQKFLIHKCKQRFTRLTQIAITERRMALNEDERHYTSVKPKVKRREQSREKKALAAAKIEKAIEKELLERLKSGAYGDKPLNVDENIWKKILGNVDTQDDTDKEEEEEEEDADLASEDEEDVGNVEYVEDEEEDDMVDMEDLERWLGNSSASEVDLSPEDESEDISDNELQKDSSNHTGSSTKRSLPAKKDTKKRPRVEIEYEQELPAIRTNIAS